MTLSPLWLRGKGVYFLPHLSGLFEGGGCRSSLGTSPAPLRSGPPLLRDASWSRLRGLSLTEPRPFAAAWSPPLHGVITGLCPACRGAGPLVGGST